MAGIDKSDQILAAIGELRTDVAVVKVHAENTKDDVGEIKIHLLKQNGRISKLERKYWIMAGGFTVVATVAGVLIKIFA